MSINDQIQDPADIMEDRHTQNPLVIQSPPVPLSTEERRTFAELEEAIAKVEHSFMESGLAMEQIRDENLYRDCHNSFDDYSRVRWGFSRQRAYQLIGAAVVAKHLSTLVDTTSPRNESQVRPLVGRPLDEAVKIWKLANASGVPATRSSVQKAIKTLFGDVPKPQKSTVDLVEGVLRACRLLAKHFGDTELSGLDPTDRSRLASAITTVRKKARNRRPN